MSALEAKLILQAMRALLDSDHVYCDECACWTNHTGAQHREKERDE